MQKNKGVYFTLPFILLTTCPDSLIKRFTALIPNPPSIARDGSGNSGYVPSTSLWMNVSFQFINNGLPKSRSPIV